ncbi:hypothetical protein EZV62_022218 [Acer yangbiense]|uniref:CCHC-type domain-containing protein n=1 Tax=Acer yangbiense TaxID=1000413 RepID=A0A5C7H8K2_9ROSI|nr:hypothetical protein EZV62_022218 [Acer yangbiense]
MVESEIAKLYENLTLVDEDGEIYERPEEDYREGEVEVDLCLVGKILSGKKVNREEERRRIWQRGPWYFDKSLMVLEKPEGMNRRSAKWIAEQIGKVIEIPTESKDCWGKFMKVKVQINITKPLKRWLRLKLDKSDVIVMVSLKYERLPEFCYFCGRIGHASKECSDEEAKLEAMKGVLTMYGSWMRASVPDRQKVRTDQQNDGILKIQGRLEERQEGKEVVMQKLGSGSIRCEENEGGQQNLSSELLNFQVKNLTASVSDQKEATTFPTTNILAKFNGSGSSNSDGLMIEGPYEKEKSKRKKGRNGNSTVPPRPAEILAATWSPPALDSFKINCRAITDFVNKRFCIGIVVRNHEGIVLSSCSLYHDCGVDFVSANVVAILKAFQFGKNCGLLQFCVESDVSNVVNLINLGIPVNSSYGNIVTDIHSIMKELGLLSISSGKKGTNKAAYGLSRQALL